MSVRKYLVFYDHVAQRKRIEDLARGSPEYEAAVASYLQRMMEEDRNIPTITEAENRFRRDFVELGNIAIHRDVKWAAASEATLLEAVDQGPKAVGLSQPPRGAEKLLLIALNHDQVEQVLGDLAELFPTIAERHGVSFARAWYWSQAAKITARKGFGLFDWAAKLIGIMRGGKNA